MGFFVCLFLYLMVIVYLFIRSVKDLWNDLFRKEALFHMRKRDLSLLPEVFVLFLDRRLPVLKYI